MLEVEIHLDEFCAGTGHILPDFEPAVSGQNTNGFVQAHRCIGRYLGYMRQAADRDRFLGQKRAGDRQKRQQYPKIRSHPAGLWSSDQL